METHSELAEGAMVWLLILVAGVWVAHRNQDSPSLSPAVGLQVSGPLLPFRPSVR